MDQNRDVLISIFSHLDWISLATSSWVCKSWRDASNYLLRNVDSQEWVPKIDSTNIQDTMFHIDEEREIHRVARWRRKEITQQEHKPFYNRPYILGKLLGIGGSSRVFQLGNLPNICVKICCGGRYVLGEGGCKCLDLFQHDSRCKKVDKLVLNSEEAVLQAIYIWASQTSEVASRLCRYHLNGMIQDEFKLLRKSAQRSTSPLKYKLFPRVFQIGLEQNRAFIVMERLNGVTLRKVLSNSYLKRPADVDTVPVDFLPPILEIMEALIALDQEIRFWHGDIKPENIMVSFSNYKMTMRCIDPVPRSLCEGGVLPVKYVASIAYNPKVYGGPSADAFGLALIMYELYTSDQPFMRYERLTFDGEEDKRPLSLTLQSWKLKHKQDLFASWLIDWMAGERSQLKVMKEKLEEFKQNGSHLTRYIPTNHPLFSSDGTK